MAKTSQARKNAAGAASSSPAEATVSDSAASAAPTVPAPTSRANNNPRLSETDLERLHQAFEETGNKRLGQVLDRVCDDADCELRVED